MNEPVQQETDWLVPVVYVVTALFLLTAACLLFTLQRAALRAAQILLLAGGVGVVYGAVLVYKDSQRPSGGSLGKALVNVPAVIVAVVMIVIILFSIVRTRILLDKRDGVNGRFFASTPRAPGPGE
jgi:NADH:ubiquinone oxidoreductase subunit 6 (subunit J)